MISQTRYLLGNDGKKVTEIDSSGLIKRIVGLPGVSLIYLAQKKEFYWVLTDYLGSTRAIIDKDHNHIALYDYDVYGSPTVLLSPPFEWDSLFTGQAYDQEINIYNFHSRFYEPLIGR